MKWFIVKQELTEKELERKRLWDSFSLNPHVKKPEMVGFTRQVVVSNKGPGNRWSPPNKKKNRQHAKNEY